MVFCRQHWPIFRRALLLACGPLSRISAAQCECGVMTMGFGWVQGPECAREGGRQAPEGVWKLWLQVEGGVYRRITNPKNLPTTCQQKRPSISQPLVSLSLSSIPYRWEEGDLGDGTSQVPCQCNTHTRTPHTHSSSREQMRPDMRARQHEVALWTGFGNGIKDAASLLQTLSSKPLSQMGPRLCDTRGRELGVRLDG